MDDNMINLGDVLKNVFLNIGNVEHVEAAEGDYIDDDGYLCCGVCGKHKEFRRNLPFRETTLVVPCMCDCGKAELERQEREAQQRKDALTVQQLRDFSIVDEQFKISTFANLVETADNAKAVRVARNYVQNFDEMLRINKGLLIYGPTGTGKTYLAACIANALMEQGVPVLVTSIIALTRGFADYLPEVIQKMRSARLLVLDDYGAERDTDFKTEQIFDLIDSRINSKKPMIITTNFPLKELIEVDNLRRKRINERILAACHPVKMAGESWRKRMTKDNYQSIVDLLEAE